MLVSAAARVPTTFDQLLTPNLAAQLDRLNLTTRKVFAGKLRGERRSKRRGQSVEFDDYRNYTPGDDLRRIDWNVMARLDRFFVKIFQEEEDLSVHVVVDASASMLAGGERCKLAFAMRTAMALAYVGLGRNDRVTCTVFGGERLERLPPVRGRRHTQRLGEFLISACGKHVREVGRPRAPGKDATFSAALRTLARAETGRGVMLIMSDFLAPEGYDDGLRYAAGAGRGFDTACVQVLSRGELDPAAELSAAGGGGGDLRLTDSESGRAAEVTVTPGALEAYAVRLDAFTTALRERCHALGMAYALAAADSDVETLILSDLRRRGVTA